MGSGGGDLRGSPGRRLAQDVGEIRSVGLRGRRARLRHGGDRWRPHRRGRYVGPEAVQELGEVSGTGDLQAVDELRLGQVLLRDDRTGEAMGTGREEGGQDPGDRPYPPVQPQLSQQHQIRRDVGEQIALGIQHRHGDRQVEAGAVLGPPGRSHVDRDPARRQVDAAAGGGGAHPVPGLESGGVGQPDHGERREPRRDVGLDLHERAVEPGEAN